MLRLPPITVTRPESLSRALEELAAEPGPRVLAGGTDLLVALKHGHGGLPPRPLLSLADLDLAGIERRGDHWRIGATTTLWDLSRWPGAHGALAAVVEAARLVAAPPIRSRATVGGNLCLDTRCVFFNQSAFWRSGRPPCRKVGGNVCHVVPGGDRCHACHQADLPPVLLALGARAEVASRQGTRTSPLADLYTGDGLEPHRLAAAELLTAVEVPVPPAGAGAAYEKLRTRRGLDFPAVAAAVYLTRGPDGTCADARVVLGAVGSGPVPVPEAEASLRGTRLSDAVLEAAAGAARRAATPAKNVDLTPTYRRRVAGVLVARAARRAWARAGGADDGTRPPTDGSAG